MELNREKMLRSHILMPLRGQCLIKKHENRGKKQMMHHHHSNLQKMMPAKLRAAAERKQLLNTTEQCISSLSRSLVPTEMRMLNSGHGNTMFSISESHDCMSGSQSN